MKLKGINPLEAHVEKLVFGLMLLFALAMLVLQFTGGSNTIEIDRKSVRPEQVMQVVKEKADSLKARLESERVHETFADYQAPTIDNPVGDDTEMPMDAVALGPAPEWRIDTAGGADMPLPTDTSYAEVTPPAPILPMASSFGGTVDPIVVQQLIADDADIAGLFPAQQPYDKFAVSIQSRFPSGAFRDLLTASPSEPNLVRIAETWWVNDLTILAVETEREELLADGTWGRAQVVESLPGRINFKERFTADDFMPRMIRTLIADARAAQLEVRRPDYYPMISGNNWIWPELALEIAAESGDPDDECQQLLRRWQSNNARIAQLTLQLDQLRGTGGGGPAAADDGRRPAPDAGGDDERDDNRRDRRGDRDRRPRDGRADAGWPAIPDTWRAQMGGRGGGGERERDDAGERERREREKQAQRAANIEATIQRLQEENDEIEQRLREECGIDPEGQPIDDPYTKVFEEDVLPITSTDSEEVTIWSHDITARPGATYRYRMRVWVTNPFYAKSASLGDDQKDLADDPAIASDYSDWSNPVAVDGERYFFAVSAQQSDPSSVIKSRARASAEIFEFYYGYWRRGSVRLDLGDPLLATAALPELPTFEISRGDDGAWVAERHEEPLSPALDMNLTGAFLLGVTGVPGDRSRPVAFFRNDHGDLITRVPRNDRESALYLRLSASAVVGLTAEVLEPGSGARRETNVPGGQERPAPGERAPIGDLPGRPGGDDDDGFTDPGIF